MTEERIGKYRVHPAAQLFPRIETTDWEALKSSIEHHGQQQPIIVQGDVLLDGRNRLYACNALGIAPRIEEYSGSLTPLQLIETLNLHRRDLTEDQRASIQAAILVMHQAERAAAAQKAGGEQHGKGRPKAVQKAGQPNKRAPRTVDLIAANAKVSRHKAEQALAVEKAAPELAEEVRNGRVTLRNAEKQLQPHKPAPPPKPKPARANNDFSIEGCMLGFALARDAAFGRCPSAQKTVLAIELLREFMPVIDLLFPHDRILLCSRTDGYKRVQLFMDNLTVERIAQLITKALDPKQRAELRDLKW